MWTRQDPRAAWALVLLSGALLAPARLESQIIIRPDGRVVPAPQEGSQQLFAADREMTQRLARAEELVEQKQFSPALKLLQSVLDQPEDLFFRGPEQAEGQVRSLKQQVEERIGGLPPEGERAYENEYGFTARQLLDESIEHADRVRLQEVVRRFFYTEAGLDATYRLAMCHMDRGEHLSAARLFERLRESGAAGRFEPALSLKAALCWSRGGLSGQAQRTLAELKERAPGSELAFGGRRVRLFDNEENALAWLRELAGAEAEPRRGAGEDWAVVRGNAARNGSSAPVSPLQETAWTYDTILGPDGDASEPLQQSAALQKRLESGLRDSGEFLALPAAHPLVSGNAVIFRTLKNVRAVDLKTGRTLWESAKTDPAFELLLQQSGSSLAEYDVSGTGQTLRETFLIQRTWRDLPSGLLSSDGRYVYALEDLGFVGISARNARGAAHPLAARDHNKLTAIEISTGRLKWEIGGQRLQPESELAGAFFLGPPLPVGGQLYCLAEENGEIRLLAIEVDHSDPERPQPKLAWGQRLVHPTYMLEHDLARRLAGLSPSFGDGVMVCPTAAGAVVGVDLTRRVLLWGYRYTPDLPDLAVQGNPAMFGAQPNVRAALSILDDVERWLDDVPVIDSGRVLLTPRDSSELHCLNVVDGSFQWKKPRGSGLYVAGVHDGKAVVVGRTQVQAYELAGKGAEAWEPIPIAAPSGRGLQTGRFYHLPLSTGEIVTIDLQRGRITARSAAPDGDVPGNLVAAGGRLLSQSAGALTAFRSLSEAEEEIEVTLQRNPDDADALARRGELRLHRGDEAEGLADLQRAVALGAGEATRALLSATVLEGLRRDFEKYRPLAEELADLIDDPGQQARYRRLYAEGLQRAGDVAAAFEQYVKLVDSQSGPGALEELGSGLSVRSDRWLSTRLADLYAHAAPEHRERLDEVLQSRLDDAIAEEGPDALREFLAWFAGSGQAEQARQALVERLDAKADSLELERHLAELRRSADAETAGEATARLVSLYLQLRRGAEAAGLLEELEQRWQNVVCLDGKTGSELAEGWRTDEIVVASLAPALELGGAPLRAERSGGRNQLGTSYPVEIVGPAGPYFSGVRLQFDQRRQLLLALDENGETRWEIPIAPLGRSVQSQYGLYARTDGHLLAVVFGNFFAVFDALTPSGTPRVLWKHDLYDSSLEGIGRGLQPRPFLPPGGGQRVVFADLLGRQAGAVGPVTARSVIFQSGSDLYAAEPLTGETLWHRRGLPRGCELFGDRDYVFALPPNADRAIVLRAGDGEPIGTRPVPEEQFRKTVVGRHILTWGPDGRRGRLALTDALSGEPLWQARFDIAASFDLIEADEVAVLEPGGRFVVLDLQDGEPRIDADVGEIEGLEEIVVRRSAERYVLLSRSSEPNPNNIRLRIGGQGYPQVNGAVHGFDRATGRKLWTTRVETSVLDTGQPATVPVLVLVEQRLPVGRPGRPPTGFPDPYSVTILDTRNGDVVYEESEKQGAFPFELRADPDRPRIDVLFNQFKIELTPDDRRSVEAPATGA